ncbi:hypothetical protein MFLAVUS_007786 [Mucor flavus]|uniref:Uncharacterized protein n=1 Tax=Mucor flavus TaxID=439312 RepID=A0ABP9Z5B0_9FUNG
MFTQISRNAAINRIPSKTSSNPTETPAEEFRLVGFVRNDVRHPIRASRAGTRGFRAPEYGEQLLTM